ncbi:hypothetical protein E2C01_054158 [Portunus trituberculatus]|uniref:Uncharacterized protein n=1 Tax=Portunus trituberculatus TaxID=210409 RepID=A0A5B7GMC1_PORTR|nr:hypothetical protein [Portunus trituberculatus]
MMVRYWKTSPDLPFPHQTVKRICRTYPCFGVLMCYLKSGLYSIRGQSHIRVLVYPCPISYPVLIPRGMILHRRLYPESSHPHLHSPRVVHSTAPRCPEVTERGTSVARQTGSVVDARVLLCSHCSCCGEPDSLWFLPSPADLTLAICNLSTHSQPLHAS